jgi:hypothetical protein
VKEETGKGREEKGTKRKRGWRGEGRERRDRGRREEKGESSGCMMRKKN